MEYNDARMLITDQKLQSIKDVSEGYPKPQIFTPQERMLVEYDNARILITDQKLESIKDVMGILEAAAKGGGPLVIIAEDVTVGSLSEVQTQGGRSQGLWLRGPGLPGCRVLHHACDGAACTGWPVHLACCKGLGQQALQASMALQPHTRHGLEAGVDSSSAAALGRNRN